MPIDIKQEQKKDYFTIKIPRPRNIERIVYILIIIALLFFLFVYNPFPQITCRGFTENTDVTAAAVNEDTDVETGVEATNDAVETIETPAEEPTQEQTETEETLCIEDWACTNWGECSEEGTQTRTCTDKAACGTTINKPSESQSCTPPTTEEEDSGLTALEGEIKYEIIDIVTEIKNPGTDYEYGKIKEVKYKIENNKETIENLKIYVYSYDTKSIADEISLVRGEASFDLDFEKGQIKEGTIKLKTGTFKDLTIDKTVKLKFYDGTTLLKTKTDVIKIK